MPQQVLIGLLGIGEPLERETVSGQTEMNVVLESRDGGRGGGKWQEGWEGRRETGEKSERDEQRMRYTHRDLL